MSKSDIIAYLNRAHRGYYELPVPIIAEHLKVNIKIIGLQAFIDQVRVYYGEGITEFDSMDKGVQELISGHIKSILDKQKPY